MLPADSNRNSLQNIQPHCLEKFLEIRCKAVQPKFYYGPRPELGVVPAL